MLVDISSDKGSVSNCRHRVNGVCTKIYIFKMSTLSDRLRELRGATSQVEMARVLGIQRTQWIKYENGTTVPSADMLANICRAHAVSSDWLLGLPTRSAAPALNAPNNSGAIAIGNGASATIGESRACAKCPYKKKLKALEKAFAK